MSVRKDGKIIAGTTVNPDLFDWKWADHILDNASWLRADTFSWQAGSVYQAAYAHLVLDVDDKTLQSETVAGTTIQFYLADDGHKVCPASEESNVTAIYNATGVAWYYIIDTTNQRFKLPRTKFGFTGLRDAVGGYVAAGLPNITGTFTIGRGSSAKGNLENLSGAFTSDTYTSGGYSTFAQDGNSPAGNKRAIFNASDSNAIYGASTTVQPPATQQYLYFYVGNFTPTALQNTAGLNAELFNDKVDKGHQVIAFQAPTAQNNYTWYRLYADGWVEIGGAATIPGRSGGGGTEVVVNLPVTMANTTYQTNVSIHDGGAYWASFGIETTTRTTTTLKLYAYLNATGNAAALPIFWEVKGMAVS